MSELIKELSILSDDSNIFSFENAQYVIPLYQRAFAWTEKEILQLINDINDFVEDHYFLGSLIVAKRENVFEVIDGQQRLTALFLLLKNLELDVPNSLAFACRDKSNYTLKNINNLSDDERVEANLQIGKKIINEKINEQSFNKTDFVDKFKRVKIYRIEVPQNTNLNRYFEIMNTRGEQLEQHDILKAKLMSYLISDTDKYLFAKIWNACSDMTGYVQMHFDTDLRKLLFGSEWRELSFDNTVLSEISDNYETNSCDTAKISDLIKPTFTVKRYDISDDNNRIRFESIIEFPFLLLHVLKVFVSSEGITGKNVSGEIIAELLDDKKLTAAFEKVITEGTVSGNDVTQNKSKFSMNFVKCLLKCRFLFDKYIIKREFVNENSDGAWSLKELMVSGQGSKKKPYYTNTYFGKANEWQITYGPRTKLNMYLQSCLRVSYTSPKIMHWITTLLKWLYDDNNFNHLDEFEKKIENIAISAVTQDFLNKFNDTYNFGVSTPHIVFNYLDYLLWKEDISVDFVFEFRNSVEHWYPQHPSEGTFDIWSHDDGVDNFGNLCIIQRTVNSKFSNMAPDAKKSTFNDMIAKGSLKLRAMANLTVSTGSKTASRNWKDDIYKMHEQEMINRLKKACNLLIE